MISLEIFKAHWEKKFPNIPLQHTHFLIAISGGIDSVVLTYLMHLAGAKFTLAHANFQLRGEESTRDEKFVTDFAGRLQAPIKWAFSKLREKLDMLGLIDLSKKYN